ncbi:MAG TPA: YqgE/AlgH family protein [Burkholderiales bacterium]|jgi:putative transcriptional regulator|nr:YqgE/AlgH family protein [Burkholderiales bacterium]
MVDRRFPVTFLIAVAFAALIGWATPALPADDSAESVILVAKRQLQDPFYRATVVLTRPMGNDQHIGVILNRPSKLTLGQLFPDHKPSHLVRDPVYVGGPMSTSVIFAIVQRHDSPGGKSLQMMPEVFMVFEGSTVDQIIEKQPAQARFVAGLVAWQPGELRDEIKRGAWYVLNADPALVLRKQTEGMWEELVRRAEFSANGI